MFGFTGTCLGEGNSGETKRVLGSSTHFASTVAHCSTHFDTKNKKELSSVSQNALNTHFKVKFRKFSGGNIPDPILGMSYSAPAQTLSHSLWEWHKVSAGTLYPATTCTLNSETSGSASGCKCYTDSSMAHHITRTYNTIRLLSKAATFYSVIQTKW